MQFEVIQHQQTPISEPITDVFKFIKDNSVVIEAFKGYAISRKDCIGLAANQCSIDGARFNFRMVAIKDIITRECIIAINPIITKVYGVKRHKAEGCLTWGMKDGRYFIITAYRNHFVDVEFYTQDGVFHKETHKGFQAQVWQHEVNHINGIEENVVSEEIWLEEPADKFTQRNDICPCGSGKKYKKCCIESEKEK